jgi:hypothetical protein
LGLLTTGQARTVDKSNTSLGVTAAYRMSQMELKPISQRGGLEKLVDLTPDLLDRMDLSGGFKGDLKGSAKKQHRQLRMPSPLISGDGIRVRSIRL